MNSLTTSALDLPDRLTRKADPTLIAGDEQHLAAIAVSLEQSIADPSDRLDAEPKAPSGTGQQAMDRDMQASVCHQGTTPASSKNPPVGPSSGRVASRIAIAAPCSGVRTPRKPLRSVAVKPGQAALIRMFVSRSSLAYWTVTAFRNVFDGAYAADSGAGTDRLRAKLSYTNIGFALAPPEFTIHTTMEP